MSNKKAKFFNIVIILSLLTLIQETTTAKAGVIQSKFFKVFKELKDPAKTNATQEIKSKSKTKRKDTGITIGYFGTFDTLNALTYSGIPAAGLSKIGEKVISDDLVYNHLMQRDLDNSGILCPLLAKSVEYSDDYSWIVYNLDENAKWQDGSPITAEDVKFSWETLKEHGRNYHQSYYKRVEKVEIIDPLKIKFYLKPIELDDGTKLYDRMLIGLISVIPILPKYYLKDKDFVRLNLEIVPLAGPYNISKVDPGRSIEYQKNQHYWGKALPTNKGLYNFNKVKYEYYRDANAMFEALKKGRFDIFIENNIKRWKNGYNFLQTPRGRKYKKLEIKHNLPVGMNAIALNTRKEKFKDIRIRKALNLVFDFDWLNKNIFHSSYKRSQSFFQNSDFMHKKELSKIEKEIINNLPNKVDIKEIDQTIKIITATGRNSDKRKNIRKAIELFHKAGWHIKKGVMVNKKDGRPFEFDILLYNNASKAIAINYAANLRRIGVRMNVRMLDESVYWRKAYNHEHDAIIFNWAGYQMPSGSMLLTRWGTNTYERGGNLNFSGFNDKNIDYLCKRAQLASTYKEYRDSLRVLDRILLSKANIIPLFYTSKYRIVINKDLRIPDIKNNTNSLSFTQFYWR